MSQQPNNQRPPNPGMLGTFFNRLMLSWRLFFDRRVRFSAKMIPLFALLYMLSPIDIAPEIIFGPLGVVDDVGVILIALQMFISMAPNPVVQEHLLKLQGRLMNERQAQNDAQQPEGQAEQASYYANQQYTRNDEDVIDGEYTVRN